MKTTNSQRPNRRSRKPRGSDSPAPAKRTQDQDQQPDRQAVWQVIAQIPRGQVASYGQIAALAGFPGRARWVGRILSELPSGTRLPWHRVVNAAGEIVDRPGAAEQRQRLVAEGVLLAGRRVARDRFWPAGETS